MQAPAGLMKNLWNFVKFNGYKERNKNPVKQQGVQRQGWELKEMRHPEASKTWEEAKHYET